MIQVVKGVRFHDLGSNLGTHAVHGPTTLDSDEAVGLLDGADDGVNVERTDGAKIDDLDGGNALLFKAFSGLNGEADGPRVGDDGEVGALTLDLGLADGDEEILGLSGLGEVEGGTVHELILQDNHGVGITDGGLEETLAVLGAPGGDDLEPGDRAVPSGVALTVLGTHTGSGTIGPTEDNGAIHDATGHVPGLGGTVDNVVDGLHGKVKGHELTDGTKAGEGSADGETSKAGFRDGGVNDPLRSKLIQETLGDLVGPVVLGYLLTHEEDLLITVHLLLQGGIEGLTHGDLGVGLSQGSGEGSQGADAKARGSEPGKGRSNGEKGAQHDDMRGEREREGRGGEDTNGEKQGEEEEGKGGGVRETKEGKPQQGQQCSSGRA